MKMASVEESFSNFLLSFFPYGFIFKCPTYNNDSHKKISEKSLKNFLEEKDCYVFEC